MRNEVDTVLEPGVVDLPGSLGLELDENEVRLITRKNEKKKKHARAQARLAQISLVSFAFFSLGR